MAQGFAGFSFGERLAVGAFGETFLAAGPGGRQANALLVDAKLASVKPFAKALLAGGEQLASVLHPNVVATLAVGREPGGRLVVLTEPLPGAQNLAEVLRDARVGHKVMAAAVALLVGRKVARGLERAHRLGVVHGGVHPRSVSIDGRGEVRLGDFAVARALAAAAAEDDSLLRGLLGYVAPEVALGDAPTPPTDVFGCAALLHELLTGSPPPGLIEGPHILLEASERALSTDSAHRQREAGAFADQLDQAAKDGLEASNKDLGVFLALVRGAAERSLDKQTDNVLANLIAELDDPQVPSLDHTPLPPPMPFGGETATGLAETLDSLFTDDEPARKPKARLPLPSPAPGQSGSNERLDTLVEPEDRAATFTATPQQQQAMLRFERVATANIVGEETVPEIHREPTFVEPSVPEPSTEPVPAILSPVSAAIDAPAPLRPKRNSAPPETSSRSTGRSSARAPVVLTEPIDHTPRGRGTLWMLAVLAVGGVVFAVWKTGMLRPGDKAAAERAATAKVAEAEKAQKVNRARYADVIVDSDKPDAAVWMRLGRTPLDSLELSTTTIYEIRVEQEGMKATDVVVPPTRWAGSGETMIAAVAVSLEAAPVGYVAPAAPGKAPPAETTGKAGRGRLHVESDPSGAEVWLLVGFTPSARVTSLSADVEHDFKVLLDGFAPGFAQVAPADFLDPSGALRPQVERKVSLRPRPGGKPGPRSP